MAELRNSVKTAFQRVYHYVGFTKGYNFILCFIFNGVLMGFTLSRLHYLDVKGTFCKEGNAAPGECYYYLGEKREHIGMILHLAGTLPGCFLAFFQFVPTIRRNFLLYHRVAGHIIIPLMLVGDAGALMICRRAFHGEIETQTISGLAVIMTTVALAMAYYNIKRLQIDQHRAWMLRAFVYFTMIITTRIAFPLIAMVTSKSVYGQLWPCGKIEFTLGSRDATLSKYPSCTAFYDGSNPSQVAVVLSDFDGDDDNIGAALGVSFGSGSVLAAFLHAVAIGIYLRLTPGESSRLRKISYERHVKAGHAHPGKSGLTVQRFGDIKE